jgi:methionine--tRNA ligase beta chain
MSRLEIRVGLVTSIKKHPDSPNLYVQTIDIGETIPRTIISGIADYCSEERLLNNKVVVVCNLKPRAIKGIESCGMVLCASNSDHTQVRLVKSEMYASTIPICCVVYYTVSYCILL